MLQGVRLEIVDDYSNLGICFKYNGNFAKAKQHLADQVQKALFSIYPKIRNKSIPLKLFDVLVKPILYRLKYIQTHTHTHTHTHTLA